MGSDITTKQEDKSRHHLRWNSQWLGVISLLAALFVWWLVARLSVKIG